MLILLGFVVSSYLCQHLFWNLVVHCRLQKQQNKQSFRQSVNKTT